MKARECDQVFMSPVWSPSSPCCASGGEEGGVRGIEGGGLNRGERGGEMWGALPSNGSPGWKAKAWSVKQEVDGGHSTTSLGTRQVVLGAVGEYTVAGQSREGGNQSSGRGQQGEGVGRTALPVSA